MYIKFVTLDIKLCYTRGESNLHYKVLKVSEHYHQDFRFKHSQSHKKRKDVSFDYDSNNENIGQD